MAFNTADQNLKNNISPLLVSGEKLDPTDEDNLNRDTGRDQGEPAAVTNAVEPEPEITSVAQGKIQLDAIGITANPYPETPDADSLKPLKNVLHNYASYTYGLSLALMTREEYNSVVDDGTYTPKRVLIASAGRHSNEVGTDREFIRAPYFEDDFYFDGLELESVIGLNAQSRNSNAIYYNFTLVEPYGFTLLDRIISLCNDIGAKNYLDMPYMLQIDFFGIDDTGKITGMIKDTTKRIPIRINKMDVNITQRGAEYRIEGVPYGHSAFDLSTVTTPANFEVTAKTVKEFFTDQDMTIDLSASTSQGEREIQTTPDGQLRTSENTPRNLTSLETRLEFGLVKSYATALNSWHKAALDQGKIGKRDTYKFNFLDPDIANSPFTDVQISSPKDTGMSSIADPTIHKANAGLNTTDYDPTKRIFQINAGTYLDRVISWVVRNSKWMTDQIVIPDGKDAQQYLQEQAAKKDTPFYWFKVVPTIKLLGYDYKRNVWAREITYNVKKYKILNAKSDLVPQGKAKNPVYAYNYIYTGKNDDILDVDIKFNALYYNALTIYKNHISNVVRPANTDETKDQPDASTFKNNEQDPNAIMPMVMKPVTYNTEQQNSSGSTTTEQVAKADIEDSLMTLSQADMLQLDLDIIGDPAYIKQDDVFWSPQIASEYGNEDPRLTIDGSLKTDDGEVYVSLKFRTPIDVDESTGLMKFDSKYQQSLFSGMYRVLTVSSKFRNGQFLQTLSLVRLVKQPQFDYAHNKKPNSEERQEAQSGDNPINNDYLLGPDFTVPAEAQTEEAVDEGPAAQERNLSPLEPPLIGPDQERLFRVNADVEEVPMTDQNEPVTIPPQRAQRPQTPFIDRIISNPRGTD